MAVRARVLVSTVTNTAGSDRKRVGGTGREIDSGDFEAEPGKQDRVRTGAASEFQYATRPNIRLLDDAAKLCRWQAAVPGSAAGFVSLIPVLRSIHFRPRNSTRPSQLFVLHVAKVFRRV